MAFPAGPVADQRHLEGGVVYRWNATDGAWVHAKVTVHVANAGGAADPDPFAEAVSPDPALFDWVEVRNVSGTLGTQYYQALNIVDVTGLRLVPQDSGPSSPAYPVDS